MKIITRYKLFLSSVSLVSLAILFVPFSSVLKTQASGTISGNVFKDFNGNGNSDTNESGISGIVVTAYNPSGAVSGTTTTLANGSYSLSATGAGPYRIEFTGIPAYLSPSAPSADSVNGGTTTDSGSTVQFVPDANTSNVNLALHNPNDYSQANPRLVIPVYENGSGVGNTARGLVSYTYTGATDVPAAFGGSSENPRLDAQIQRIGATWGVGYQKTNKRLFASAMTKRHVGFGPRGADGVYILDYSNSASASIVGGFDLQGVIPANGGAAIDVGSVTRTNITGEISSGSAGDNQISSDRTKFSRDLDAFDKVGKTSFGNAEISEDGNTLWLVNLNQRALISVNISNFTPSLTNPATPPGPVNQYLLSSMSGLPTCNNGEFRPWALTFQDGLGYLGGVCSAENIVDRTNSSDVEAIVLSFDPNNPTAGFTTVSSFGLDYNREVVEVDQPSSRSIGKFHPWAKNWADTGLPFVDGRYAYPQPILSGIEFTENGSMVLGFSDRFGHQSGYGFVATSNGSPVYSINSGGDIIQLCRSGSSFILEGLAGCFHTDLMGSEQSAELSNDGPNGVGEYYYRDEYSTLVGNHLETTTGALVIKKGTGEISTTVYDPLESTMLDNWGAFGQGLHFYNSTDGTRTDSYVIVNPAEGGDSYGFAKGNGLGDMELLSDAAPIEIGNRIWRDTDGDGVQDPGEIGIAGVTVHLYSSTGVLIATAVTDANGEYYFISGSAADGNTGDNIGIVNGQITPNTNYQIRFDNSANYLSGGPLFGLLLTQANSTLQNGDDDSNDSDASNVTNPTGSPSGTFPVIAVTTGGAGQNNHTLDVGFKFSPTAASVSVSGRISASDGRGIRNVIVGLTLTDGTYLWTRTGSFGYYTFDDVRAGQTVVVSVKSKRFNFTPEEKLLSLEDSVTDFNFTADAPNLSSKSVNTRTIIDGKK